MFDWVPGTPLEKKLFKVLTFVYPLINFVPYKGNLKMSLVPDSMEIEAHFNFGIKFAIIYNFG